MVILYHRYEKYDVSPVYHFLVTTFWSRFTPLVAFPPGEHVLKTNSADPNPWPGVRLVI